MVDKILCPLLGSTGNCVQVVKPVKGGEVSEIVCGFYSPTAGRCSVGLLADGLKSLMQQADRIANAAEAIYAVLDPEDDEDCLSLRKLVMVELVPTRLRQGCVSGWSWRLVSGVGCGFGGSL